MSSSTPLLAGQKTGLSPQGAPKLPTEIHGDLPWKKCWDVGDLPKEKEVE